MNPILKENTSLIYELCEAHKVRNLYAFGSVLTSNFNERSDIDLLVDFFPQDVLDYAEKYYQLKFVLKEILKRDIDLLEEKAIRNPFFKDVVNQNKYLLYGYPN